MTYDKLVFMFDFENVGDGSDQSTFYFDDIEQLDASGGLSQIDLPCTFEDETVDQTTYDFGAMLRKWWKIPPCRATMWWRWSRCPSPWVGPAP